MSALLGALIWAILIFIPAFDPSSLPTIQKLFLLGPLVIVPLGLRLVAKPSQAGKIGLLFRLILFAQPFGAALAACSFLLSQGVAAALLASAWLSLTGLIALFGLARLLLGGRLQVEEVCIDAGLMYISVGGGWLIMSRLGWQPLGFGDNIVLLTAVHFHYAAFAAPILAGLAGRALPASKGWTRSVFAASALGIIVSPLLIAAGISFYPALALAGALVVAVALLLLAVLVVFSIVPQLPSGAGRVLLVVSSVSSAFAMPLACLYAYSIVTRQVFFNIPQMAMMHGISNALGFSLCGMLAWTLTSAEI